MTDIDNNKNAKNENETCYVYTHDIKPSIFSAKYWFKLIKQF